jgi:hypothetical protein
MIRSNAALDRNIKAETLMYTYTINVAADIGHGNAFYSRVNTGPDTVTQFFLLIYVRNANIFHPLKMQNT